MAKTKISEFDAVAANNTDIDSINIAEGCAPSGINNAIRELMAQLKDQQTGTSGDSFTVGGALTVNGAASVTGNLAVSGTASVTGILTAPTATAGTNTTQVATTAFVTSATLKDPTGNGMVARTSLNTTINRTITASTGIAVTNGDGVSGNPTISNSGVLTVNGSSGDVTINQLTSGTAITASGASVNFTGIPSTAKRITVMINGVSPSTAVIPQVQVGSGSLQTTGYIAGVGYYLGGPATGSGSSTTGFPIRQASGAADVHYGIMTLVLLGSNTWIATWIGYMSNNTTQETGAGSVTLSGALDRLSLVVSSTFDAGTVNIMWE